MHINISISNEILETEYQISSDQISQLVNVLQGSYINVIKIFFILLGFPTKLWIVLSNDLSKFE